MKKLRAAALLSCLVFLALAFYIGWSDNGPSLGFWPFM